MCIRFLPPAAVFAGRQQIFTILGLRGGEENIVFFLTYSNLNFGEVRVFLSGPHLSFPSGARSPSLSLFLLRTLPKLEMDFLYVKNKETRCV